MNRRLQILESLTVSEVSKIIDRYQSGESIRKIALDYREYACRAIIVSVISGVLKSSGVTVYRSHNMNGVAKISEDDVQNYVNGETADSIATRIGTDGSVVLRRLRERGIKTRGVKEAAALCTSNSGRFTSREVFNHV